MQQSVHLIVASLFTFNLHIFQERTAKHQIAKEWRTGCACATNEFVAFRFVAVTVSGGAAGNANANVRAAAVGCWLLAVDAGGVDKRPKIFRFVF